MMVSQDPFRTPAEHRAQPVDGVTCPCCGRRTSYRSNWIQLLPNRFSCSFCKARLKHGGADLIYGLIFLAPILPLLMFERYSLGFWIYSAGYLLVGFAVYSWLIAWLRRTGLLVAA